MILAAHAAWGLALLLALADPGPGLSCKEGIAPWKGKPVEELVKAWGPPTSEKALPRGRRRLVYDLVPDAPREGETKAAGPPRSVTERTMQHAIPPVTGARPRRRTVSRAR